MTPAQHDIAAGAPAQEPLRIFVGVDESQLVAFRVLEYSIRKSSSIPVEVHPMLEYGGRRPAAPENQPRTAFSFCRFTIPERCGHRGRALYLDADMLVLGDVAELAALEFGPFTVLQSASGRTDAWVGKDPISNFGAQAAVMLLDCGRLAWDSDAIVAGLDEGLYTYEDLMGGLCIVAPDEISDAIPAAWNDLEHHDPATTRLVHFTVVPTQPWKNDSNPLGGLWVQWFEEAVAAGAVPVAEVEALLTAGHLKPSLRDALRCAPPAQDGTAPSLERDAALAALHHRVEELEAKLDAMRASSSWRIGSAIVHAPHQVANAGRRVRATIGRAAARARKATA